MYLLADQAIARNIWDYIAACGDGPYGWYVGIATDPRSRLFSDHNVDSENGCWVYENAGSEVAARATEAYILEQGGVKGGTGGGINPRYVYAYQVTDNTKE